MDSLEKLQETIDETDGGRTEPKPSSPKPIMALLSIPVAAIIALWFYSETQDAFCTVIVVMILTYFMMGIIHGIQGDIIIPERKPELPPDIEIPEEFMGRPKLYLAYLIEQAAEQDQLARIIGARGAGSDPLDKMDRWDLL